MTGLLARTQESLSKPAGYPTLGDVVQAMYGQHVRPLRRADLRAVEHAAARVGEQQIAPLKSALSLNRVPQALAESQAG